jgi:hypothetical protein
VPGGVYALLRLGTKILSIVKPGAPYFPPPGAARLFSCPYLPECVEEEFCEVRGYKVCPHGPAPVAIEAPGSSSDPNWPAVDTSVARIRYEQLRLATLAVPENFRAP